MTPTVSQLRELDPPALLSLAVPWNRAAREVADAKELIDRQMLPPLRGQRGETATASETQLALVAENCEYARIQCGLVETALNGLVEELSEAKSRLQAALDEAAEYGFTVDEDGAVTYPAVTGDDGSVLRDGGTALRSDGLFERMLDSSAAVIGEYVDSHRAAAQDLANRIGRALRSAEEVDAEYHRALSELDTVPGLEVTSDMWVDAGADTARVGEAALGALSPWDIPGGGSPERNREWWDGLSERDRDAYLALHPERIGALDGLPAEIRDMANRGVLQMEQGRVTEELAAHRANGPEESGFFGYQSWLAEEERLLGQLRGMEAIESRFAQTGIDGLPDAYLLGFDAEGNGRAIIANGNPDTADHTAVYVPGTGSRLAGAEGDINRMSDMWRTSARMVPDQSVSTITWIGYDAPQEIVTEASRRDYAYEGAPQLGSFTEGLEVAQGGPDASHTTLLGHSYGSTVIGAVAKEGSVTADDIIAVGSPGMLVPYASDLDVGADHVWSLAAGATEDVVPNAGRMFLGENDVGLDIGRFGIPHFDTDVVPNVPSDREFGGHLVANDSTDHSAYFDHNSLSQRNQARIIMGLHGEVGLE
ncbi:alpha/beta hydrolase [Streptomyces radicis]|uniref:DUF1023 domain-containing protein n=1 Tax=Streptomyces radicis TaxID=1750517 RepID=A0A3A9WQY5_9ACTN|nr:alpha/beta hydrolase [Streptomyces radicis]RKN08617.1 hypothetical protein D7319_14580 [Streptomyces radicis]RKN21775.1 hypothetical protein D7318_15535 [Streptomyces radicis]